MLQIRLSLLIYPKVGFVAKNYFLTNIFVLGYASSYKRPWFCGTHLTSSRCLSCRSRVLASIEFCKQTDADVFWEFTPWCFSEWPIVMNDGESISADWQSLLSVNDGNVFERTTGQSGTFRRPKILRRLLVCAFSAANLTQRQLCSTQCCVICYCISCTVRIFTVNLICL